MEYCSTRKVNRECEVWCGVVPSRFLNLYSVLRDMEKLPALLPPFLIFFLSFSLSLSDGDFTGNSSYPVQSSPADSLCAQLIEPNGYSCTEHTVQTKDGYILALHRVSSRSGDLRVQQSHPVLLQHGLFMAGDAWFLDSTDRSLGFILADQGFDVWVGNVRGTRWSRGHVSLSETEKEFWEWSWQELALYDLAEMLHYINSVTSLKIFIVGHSQGTIMSLAALTQPDIVEMVEAAALLSPISYLEHVSAPLVLRMVAMHLDQMVLALGIHQLNFRSDVLVNLVESLCDGHVDCTDFLTSITGQNCCFNKTRMDFYLEYEPHPSSVKNLRHLFQMIRQGTFSQYDYGIWKNILMYGRLKPPAFDLNSIPKSLPLWMSYGGNDALADIMDVQRTLEELLSKPELLYLENYGHIDFLLSIKANRDVYDNMIGFLRSLEKSSSS
ncbi:PREDICTED: triacylglycerol lipase 1 [Theobroma cacao]|uniref:Lipase n=1 Tax=Theobroma cacao TaxID=3641 RepID=A0AB32W0P3_THECC|nr:PREDICTED: triacylglycerol lipase 1 [Theobroma cacao]